MKIYKDKRGWEYAVMCGLKPSTYTVGYRKPGKVSFHSVRTLPWYKSSADAEKELERYALKKKMSEVKSGC